LLPDDWPGDLLEIRRDFELVPELHNPADPWAIAVRADGRTLGHLPGDDCERWAAVVRRVIASGCAPVVPRRVYAYEADGWGANGVQMRATVQLRLGDPETALPLNDPPAVPYTMLPRSSIVQVIKEDEHYNDLLRFVPPGGYGLLFVTLHEDLSRPSRSVVEVRIDGIRIGQLTPQMSQLLFMVSELLLMMVELRVELRGLEVLIPDLPKCPLTCIDGFSASCESTRNDA